MNSWGSTLQLESSNAESLRLMVELQLGKFDIHQVLRSEVVRCLKIQALRVYDRNDGHLHLCIGKVNAAGAAVIVEVDLEEVLVAEFGAMAGWLE